MKNKVKSLTIVLTAIYFFMVVWIILFKMSTLSEIAYLSHIRNINLMPFHYDIETLYHRSEIINNVIIFIPFGFYLKMLKMKGIKAIILGMALSVGLEILQFILAVGATDITDIMMNTAGTVIGVSFYALLYLIFRKSDTLDKVLCVLASIFTVLLISFVSLLIFLN